MCSRARGFVKGGSQRTFIHGSAQGRAQPGFDCHSTGIEKKRKKAEKKARNERETSGGRNRPAERQQRSKKRDPVAQDRGTSVRKRNHGHARARRDETLSTPLVQTQGLLMTPSFVDTRQGMWRCVGGPAVMTSEGERRSRPCLVEGVGSIFHPFLRGVTSTALTSRKTSRHRRHRLDGLKMQKQPEI